VAGCSALRDNHTRSLLARESNRYGQIITRSEGSMSVPNMHSPRESPSFFFGVGVWEEDESERMYDTNRMTILRWD